MRNIQNVCRLISFVVLMVTGALVMDIVANRSPVAAQTGELAPTPLEAFAAKPGATMVWSRTIGQLDSSASRATVTAVAYDDPTSTPRLMRGLRIGLVHLQPNPNCNLRFRSHAILCARPNAAVFFDENSLERVRAGIQRGNAEHNLIISFRKEWSGNQAVGLIIGGYTFDHRQPADLIALVERGMSELKNAPR